MISFCRKLRRPLICDVSSDVSRSCKHVTFRASGVAREYSSAANNSCFASCKSRSPFRYNKQSLQLVTEDTRGFKLHLRLETRRAAIPTERARSSSVTSVHAQRPTIKTSSLLEAIEWPVDAIAQESRLLRSSVVNSRVEPPQCVLSALVLSLQVLLRQRRGGLQLRVRSSAMT